MGGQRKKLVVVGDERVGKTALLLVYCGAPFPEQHFSTVSDSYTNANSQYYELCDTAGTQEFDRLRPFSYDNADAFLIAFSIDDPLSLENVEEKWVHEVRYFSAKVPILLVGLKRDLRSDPETIRKLARQQLKPVQYEEGMEVANRIGAYRYVECSAKLNSGIESVFQGMRQSLDEGDRQKMDVELRNLPKGSKQQSTLRRRRSSMSSAAPSLNERTSEAGEVTAGPSIAETNGQGGFADISMECLIENSVKSRRSLRNETSHSTLQSETTATSSDSASIASAPSTVNGDQQTDPPYGLEKVENQLTHKSSIGAMSVSSRKSAPKSIPGDQQSTREGSLSRRPSRLTRRSSVGALSVASAALAPLSKGPEEDGTASLAKRPSVRSLLTLSQQRPRHSASLKRPTSSTPSPTAPPSTVKPITGAQLSNTPAKPKGSGGCCIIS